MFNEYLDVQTNAKMFNKSLDTQQKLRRLTRA